MWCMSSFLFTSDVKKWIKISTIGFFTSYSITTGLGMVFPSQLGWFIQAYITFLGGAKGGVWTSEQIFWHVLAWNTMVIFIILAMGVLALSFTYPLTFGVFVGLTAGTWCYRHGVSFNPWALIMVPWGTHGWIEVAYMIFASGITMKIGTEMYGIKDRHALIKHMFSAQRPVSGWKQAIKPILKEVLKYYACIVIPAVVFGAFFEAYLTDIIFQSFYPT